MFKSRMFKISFIAIMAGLTILGFQNCAPAKFKEVSSVSGVSFSTGNTDSDIAAVDTTLLEPQTGEQLEPRSSDAISSIVTAPPQDPEVQTPAEIPNDGATAKEKTPEVTEVVDVKSPEKTPEGVDDASTETPPVATTAPVDDESEGEDDLVECDLGGPNSKVILSGNLKKGSNASSTRVCMSENACLTIINAFAAQRDCSLAQTAGASNSPTSEQCTQIFPGSRGTCKNASKLADDQVAAILKNME